MVKGKKVTTVNIDAEVLRLAKREIPNISVFIEDCFRAYLGLDDENITGIQDELNRIKDARLKIHLLSKEDDLNSSLENRMNKKKMNEVWIKIWGVYRTSEVIYPADLINASNIIGVSPEDLKDFMNDLLLFVPKSDLGKCDDYFYAREVHKDFTE